MPNALIEAMGRGRVPLATLMKSGVPDLVRDGDNGFLVPIGGAAAFANRLRILWRRGWLRRRMSARAYRTVANGRYRVEDMVRSYAAVFDRAHKDAVEGRLVRQPGELNHPPAEVAGVSLFPVELDHYEPGVGRFVSEDDADEYRREIRLLEASRRDARPVGQRPPDELPVIGMKVFIACPIWVASGDNQWAADLARGLRLAGVYALLLLTEESTTLVRIPGPRLDRPADIPVEDLELAGADGWGARWGALVKLLEHSAPCFHLPHYDWRHAGITPVLSHDVMVIGTCTAWRARISSRRNGSARHGTRLSRRMWTPRARSAATGRSSGTGSP